MSPLNYPSVRILVFFVPGLLVAYNFKIRESSAALLGICALLLTGFAIRLGYRLTSGLFTCTAGGFAFSLGLFAMSTALPENQVNHYTKFDSETEEELVLQVVERLRPTQSNFRYICEVLKIDKHESSGSILVQVSKENQSVWERDDVLLTLGKTVPIQSSRNPYEFDYADYMSRKGISRTLFLKGKNTQCYSGTVKSLTGYAERYRNHLLRKIGTYPMGTREKAVFQALVLGERSDITSDLRTDYADAGVMHILAVSGLHVGILLLGLQWLTQPLKRFKRGKTLQLVLVVVLLWNYAFISGLSPSVIRAVCMYSFIAYALYLNRKGQVFNTLSWSMFFILLLIDPLLILDIGFQMSYAALLGILFFFPVLKRIWEPRNKIPRNLRDLIGVSCSAQLGVLPFSLHIFHQFAGLFLITNILIMPFMGLVLGLGFLVILLEELNILPVLLVKSYDGILFLMNELIHTISKIQGATIHDIPFDETEFWLLNLLLLMLGLCLNNFKKRLALLAAFTGLLLIGYMEYKQISLKQSGALVVLHRNRASALYYRKGDQGKLYTSDSTAFHTLASDLRTGDRLKTLQFRPLKNSYSIPDQSILILDQSGVYPENFYKNPIVILTNSPKINLNRFLNRIQPSAVYADGSNYTSFIERWQKSCDKMNIPFQATRSCGAIYLMHFPH